MLLGLLSVVGMLSLVATCCARMEMSRARGREYKEWVERGEIVLGPNHGHEGAAREG